MSFEIAIPSYGRADSILEKTLGFLVRNNVPPEIITVFATNDQVVDYAAKARAKFGRKVCNYVRTEITLPAARKTIHFHYPIGTRVLQVDDDLNEILVRINEKQVGKIGDFMGTVEECFDIAKHRLWGIYPTPNPFFMKNAITTDLCHIVGCFFGSVSNHDENLLVSLSAKEDYERTIKYYLRDNAVVRFNHLAPKTNYYSAEGGLATMRTPDSVREEVRYLCNNWPQFISLNPQAKRGYLEIRIQDFAKRRTAHAKASSNSDTAQSS